jgi:hypothetical protein
MKENQLSRVLLLLLFLALNSLSHAAGAYLDGEPVSVSTVCPVTGSSEGDYPRTLCLPRFAIPKNRRYGQYRPSFTSESPSTEDVVGTDFRRKRR